MSFMIFDRRFRSAFGNNQHPSHSGQSRAHRLCLVDQLVNGPGGQLGAKFRLVRDPRRVHRRRVLPVVGGFLLAQRAQSHMPEQRAPIQGMRGRLVVQRHADGHHHTTARAKDAPDFAERLDQVRREEERVAAPHAVDRSVRQPGGGQIPPLEPGTRSGQRTLGALPGDLEAGFGEIDPDEVASGSLGQPETRSTLTARQVQ